MSFQFHYGSIKITSRCLLSYFCMQFQFHYGSIKIVFFKAPVYGEFSFNSTMVRLK